MLALLAAILMQTPQTPPGFWERDTLLDDLGGIRTTLHDHGITFVLAWTGEVLSNVHGGVQRDVGVDQLLDGVFDVDLDKAVGWSGGSARINPMWLAGDGIAGDVGDLTLVSNITGRGGARIFEAWIQQAIAGVLSVRAGILAADQEFALTSAGTLYYNSVFGGPVFMTPNFRWPIYPVGAPGVRVHADVADHFYIQGLVADGDPGSEGFNRSGVRFRLSAGEGLFSMVEAGWTVGDTTIKGGSFYHSAGSGVRGGYGLVEHRVAGGVEAFLRLGFSEEDRSLVSMGIDGDINFTGLIPGRSADVLGLGVIYARISRDFARMQPDRPLWGHETVVELTYKIPIAKWWSLQPDVQYVVHPGGSTATPNAVVVGFRIDLLL